MTRSLYVGTESPAILVIDALELRRAGVVSLLKPWTDAHQLRIIANDPQRISLVPELEPNDQYQMILLILGSAAVGDPKIQAWIASLSHRHGNVPLVLVSDREDAAEVVAALEAGVRGFIPTSIAPSVALQALAFIMSGGSFFPPAALTEATRVKALPQVATGRELTVVAPVPKGIGLTVRQQQVLERLIQGASNKLIGRQLQLRESTVKVHVRHIMKKLGAANRTQAALCAASQNAPAGAPVGKAATAPPPIEGEI
jgi:DNA-binding NarL/FixJ family response regulator